MPTDQLRIAGDVRAVGPTPCCHTLPHDTLHDVAQAALRRVAAAVVHPAATPAPPLPEMGALCTALCAPGIDAARAMIDDLRARGVPDGDILHSHLPAAARMLGEQWENDEISFVVVAQAVGRLQRLVHHLRRDPPRPGRGGNRQALFATLPGETHTLGVVIAADSLRQNGWDIDLSLGESQDALLDQLAEQDHALLGLSIGSARTARSLAALLPDLRAAAPRTRILLSGAYIATEPEAAARLAADGWARDVAGALREMARLAGDRAA
ncbi:cobalamin B12-binding domain-containing protein [Rhodovulum adriaticum]|uniref:Methanogenic corrinoid protein MtbC1 n=1 Tax=Rhodovulum adriaticum TaxID=35804 RepID=A0A4R2NJF4_RHOAD|nr:cobalamin B12-binding domain-containing protein [Rhodovulum adriaticum]TCP21462.1 methanogenic corrinoid protein MtbC1 [Rhodovulum adriaticum]